MKVVVLESMGISELYLKEFSDELKMRGHCLEVFNERSENFQELKTRSKDADVILLSNIPFPNDLIDNCSHLKMISVVFLELITLALIAVENRLLPFVIQLVIQQMRLPN